ncbi:MAG: hypothetical protein L0922_06095, partial [Candidatus Mariimomonas ferrooxydans]
MGEGNLFKGFLVSPACSTLPQPSLTGPEYSTLPQPSLTGPGTPYYLNHHSHLTLHTTSTSLTPDPPHYLNHHSP